MRSGKLLLVVTILSFYIPLFAQSNPNTDQGLKPYDSLHGGNLDSVSMTSGNLFFHHTEYGAPQRGRAGLTASLQYNNKGFQLQIVCVNGSKGPWQMPPSSTGNPSSGGNGCTAYYTWHFVGNGVTLIPDQTAFVGSTYQDSGFHDSGGNEIWLTTYNALTSDGAKHPLADTGNGYRAIDGSGIFAATPSGAVEDRTGLYSGGQEDSNGNFLSIDNSNNWIDTLGRAIPLVPGPIAALQTPPPSTASLSSCPNLNLTYQPLTYAYTWNPPGPTGTSPFILCFASVYIRSAMFGSAYLNTTYFKDVSESVTFLQSVVRPDGTAWTFTYDGANPNDTTSVGYGDLIKIGFPTGGSISYAYATEVMYQGQWISGMPTFQSRSVTSRAVDANDGTGPHTWNYNWNSNIVSNTGSSYVAENTVIDPLGNGTVHQITGFYGGPSLFETQTRYYQGSQSSGTLLKTVNTDYNYSLNPFDQLGPNTNPPTAMNVEPIRVTTILLNGLTTKEEKDYDSGFSFRSPLWGLPIYPPANTNVTYPATLSTITARREYDYGSGSAGSLLRQTLTTYLWQGNSNYLNSNLLDLPSSVVVQDGNGNRVAETDSTYDESQYLTTSSISTQHGVPPTSVRGNLTTVSRWLNTGSPVVTHTNWYDTGEAYQSIDALGNATTHSNDLAYAGAYSTKTCNPLGQCVSGTYDFNSGLLTSFTDANGSPANGNTQGDPAHTWNYSYDSMFRMTQALSPPDPNGQRPETDFYYPNATTVERCKKQSGNAGSNCTSGWIVDYAYFDGLGRTSQTRLVDPEGDDYVDTTYDALGRVSTVSNPHRSASSSTDGITINSYDALGRVTQTTKQDGSMTVAQYDLVAGITNCMVTTDEAGNQRRSCTDGLGRLVEVDEPQASSTGTSATTSVTISGSLQSGSGGSIVTTASGTPIVMGNMDDIYVLGSNEHVYEYYDWRGWWSGYDVTGATSAATAGSGTQMRAYYDSSGRTYVFYVGSNQHLEDVYFNGSWNTQDLTNTLASGVVPASATPISMAGAGDFYYMDSGGSIYEITLLSNGTWAGWSNFNLMYATGATHAATSSPITAYRDGSSSTHVLYIGSDQHLEHAYYNVSAGSWQAQDLTTILSGAVTPASNTPIVMGGGETFTTWTH